MALKIQTQEDDSRQLAVTIEVEKDRIKKAMRKTARKTARSLRIPGFRPGRAPYNVVVGYVGEESLRQDALNEILPGIFAETLEEIDVQPYAQPTLDEVEPDPLVLKITIPLDPVVELGDYRSTLRKEITPVEITEEAVQERIDSILEQKATVETVERAVALGDTVKLKGTGIVAGDEEDVIFREEEGFETKLEDGGLFPNTGFNDEVVGMVAGDEKSFSVTFPDPYEDDAELAGKSVDFTISVVEVKETTLPELTDEFVQDEAGDAETVEEFRASIGDQLQTEAENQFKSDLLDETIKDLVENVEEMVYPKGAVEAEIDEMLSGMKNQIQQMGWDWASYVQASGRTEKEIRDDYEDGAVDRLESRLAFAKFVETEMLEVTADEIDADIERRLSEDYDDDLADRMREFFKTQGAAMVGQQLLMDKVHERLVAIYSGEAPDLEALAAEKEAAEVADDEETADPAVSEESDDVGEVAEIEDSAESDEEAPASED